MVDKKNWINHNSYSWREYIQTWLASNTLNTKLANLVGSPCGKNCWYIFLNSCKREEKSRFYSVTMNYAGLLRWFVQKALVFRNNTRIFPCFVFNRHYVMVQPIYMYVMYTRITFRRQHSSCSIVIDTHHFHVNSTHHQTHFAVKICFTQF